jgi:hypothetical protein
VAAGSSMSASETMRSADEWVRRQHVLEPGAEALDGFHPAADNRCLMRPEGWDFGPCRAGTGCRKNDAMTRRANGEGMESHHSARLGARRDSRPPELDDIRAELETLARALRALWSSTLQRGDFEEVTRIVEASHAVHRAVVAFSPDRPAPEAGRFPEAAATG